MQGSDSKLEGFRVGSKQSEQLVRDGPGKDGSQSHNHRRESQGGAVDLLYPAVFSGTGIVADQRTDSLHNAVGTQINKRLKLVVNTQNQHIFIRESGEDSIQCRDQQRRKPHIQRSRDTDSIQTLHQLPVFSQVFALNFHRNG